MNTLQRRLLLETEWKFYLLQDSTVTSAVLAEYGFKPNPSIERMTDAQLIKLCKRCRVLLRS